jgi:hypothetical protein
MKLLWLMMTCRQQLYAAAGAWQAFRMHPVTQQHAVLEAQVSGRVCLPLMYGCFTRAVAKAIAWHSNLII